METSFKEYEKINKFNAAVRAMDSLRNSVSTQWTERVLESLIYFLYRDEVLEARGDKKDDYFKKIDDLADAYTKVTCNNWCGEEHNEYSMKDISSMGFKLYDVYAVYHKLVDEGQLEKISNSGGRIKIAVDEWGKDKIVTELMKSVKYKENVTCM